MKSNGTNSSRERATVAVAALLFAFVLFWSQIEGLAHAHADGEHDEHGGHCVVCQQVQASLDLPLPVADVGGIDTVSSPHFEVPAARPVAAEPADDRRARGPPARS